MNRTALVKGVNALMISLLMMAFNFINCFLFFIYLAKELPKYSLLRFDDYELNGLF